MRYVILLALYTSPPRLQQPNGDVPLDPRRQVNLHLEVQVNVDAQTALLLLLLPAVELALLLRRLPLGVLLRRRHRLVVLVEGILGCVSGG